MRTKLMLATAMAAAITLGTAGTASAAGAYYHCNSGYWGIWCSPALADLNVRAGGPSTSYPTAFVIPKGSDVQLICYTEGQSINGDNLWIQVNESAQYVTDYYVGTGSQADLKAHINHC
ncbi:hypothetical protein Lesp02_57940 [Lentzea sp. NBRC 105346]|uniref:hypothetical protein n=1 Tax=Lentzea sp. NBRC 105346 TaxID=3032205 RepID=UPI0024A08C61|nr:hypothetical protein [Lentzea sp. NBRC 105346]GLZ33606.1 hypothetical protein Lesp02_57940 [Lentzea sp. NBRC 105346]